MTGIREKWWLFLLLSSGTTRCFDNSSFPVFVVWTPKSLVRANAATGHNSSVWKAHYARWSS